MITRDGTPPEAPSDQALVAAVENDSEKKPASASMERLEAQ